MVHERYFSPHKQRGTPPRKKTLRRYHIQALSGVTSLVKAVWAHGILRHPTKGHVITI